MDIELLREKFLEKTKYDVDKRILAILFYGSRVKGNNKDSSDLDVLLITEGSHDFKIGMEIDGIQVDCQSYGIQTLSDIMYEKKRCNNQYFASVFQHCMIVKNENMTVEFALDIFHEYQDMKRKKFSLSGKMLDSLQEYYLRFKETEEDYFYYNLLEFIRKSYHVLFGCSYVSVLKVWDVYQQKEKYEKEDCLKLPVSSFIYLYIESLGAKESVERWECLKKLFSFLSLDSSFLSRKVESCSSFLSEDEIRSRLLVFANKVEKVVSLLNEQSLYGDAAYFILLREIREFHDAVYGEEKDFYSLFLEGTSCSDFSTRMSFLFQLFSLVEKDYHFDYKNYVLKL